jgi:DHA1 family tetracycline resistance protein-like MFS transporter
VNPFSHPSVRQLPAAFWVLWIGTFVASLCGGVAADRFGRKRILLLSMTGGALSMLGFPWLHGFWGYALGAMGNGFFCDLSRPVVAAVVTDLVPELHRTTAIGLLY